MAFNFGSLLMNLGRALPGFVEGERAAIQDNWTDLSNYNEVKQGQLSNLFREAAWPYALSNVRNQAVMNENATIRDTGDTGTWFYGLRGRNNAAAAESLYSTIFEPLKWDATFGAINKMRKKTGGMNSEQQGQLQTAANAQAGVGPDGSPLPGSLDYGGILGLYGLGGGGLGGFGGFGGYGHLPQLVNGDRGPYYY